MFKRIAALAGLARDAGENELFDGTLTSTLMHFQRVRDAARPDSRPLNALIHGSSHWRADRVEDSPAPEAWLANAPSIDAGFYTIPAL